MPASLVRSVACAVLFGVLPVSSALADPDATMVGTRLTEAVAATGRATLTYDSATASADSVAIAGVKITATDGTTIEVPSLVFSGIVDRPAGGFFAASVTADAGSARGDTKTASWATASFEDVIIPSADEVTARAPITLFQHAAIANPSISEPEIPATVSAASVAITLTPAPDGSPAAISVRAGGVTIPTSFLDGTFAGMMIGMMQYTEFVGDVALDGTYDAAAGTAELQTMTLDVPTVGKITLNGKASAFAMAEIASPDVETSKAARANARLDHLTLRFDNAGFVERMLEMQAKMLGGTPDDVRAQLVGGALPFALSFVKNATFRTQFLAAVDAFLKDPRSLTITFQPAEPVPLGQVVRTAAREPATLPDLLSPTVEANN